MPEPKNEDPIAYSDLPPLVQGYADALYECEGNSSFQEDWNDITREDFATKTLMKMSEDCAAFYAAAITAHPDGEDGLLMEIDEYDLGYNFYLDRQGTGVGFRDRDLEELGDRLEEIAAGFGWIEVEISDGREIVFLTGDPDPAVDPAA